MRRVGAGAEQRGSGVTYLAAAAVTVHLSGDHTVPETTISLRHGAAGGTATTTNGVAGTRRGNATAWTPFLGTSPAGDWQLSFGSEASALFGSGVLDDILLVLSWTGQGPAWAR
ncbi:hypothetical protein [Streptomyces sp. SID12488]|uniref:hypothetical protein n=1 Tax=Streptomyces sp. SID12488 TaxID=2706040 RepID=UPI0013DA81D9|nr:hypothetical protein [Streptomyces sp. SID12488]NEA66993.1 hypothetical protein [Streptomyces sp. SID12488]